MSPRSPLESLDPADVTSEAVDRADLRVALTEGGNRQRVHAAKITASLAAANPEYVEPLLPTIAEVLGDERVVVDRELASALASVADESPEALAPAVGPLVDLLAHDVPVVRSVAALPVRLLAIEEPDLFTAHVDSILSALEHTSDDPTTGFEAEPLEEPDRFELHQQISQDEGRRQLVARTVAAAILNEVCDRTPTALTAHDDRLIALLDGDNPAVVGASADCLGALSETGTDVSHATQSLCTALDAWAYDDATRARLVRAVGRIGDPEATPAVERVASDEDAPAELCELAHETVEWLEEQRD